MAVSIAIIKVLWAKCGNTCALCKMALTYGDEASELPIGEQAHIAGDNPGSARYDATMTDIERNNHTNLILLCPTCHTKIDKDPNSFKVERLLAVKSEHENSISEAIKANTLEVTFFELEATLRHLIDNEVGDAEESLLLIPPKEKIKKNMLSSKTEQLLQVGLLQSKQVEDYLNKNADMDYAVKLRSSFVASYKSVKSEGNVGDNAFYALLGIASNGNANPKYMAAGLSVLAYYFQLCEVFEK
jgi:hypothetical protein